MTNGLTGYYIASSYSAATKQWMDLSGLNNHATVTGALGDYTEAGLNDQGYVAGGVNEVVTWPQVRPCRLWHGPGCDVPGCDNVGCLTVQCLCQLARQLQAVCCGPSCSAGQPACSGQYSLAWPW